MSKVKVNTEWCKACGFCVRECPKQAIEMTSELNGKGYTHIRVDEAKCVKCGVCYWACPDSVFEVEA